MSKQLARLLKADIQDTSDLKSIAKMLAGKGRGKDTILAHITLKEAEVLKEAGGSGTTNPETGLLEFEGGFEDYRIPDSYSYGAGYAETLPPVSDSYPEEYQRGSAADIVSPERQAAQQYQDSAFPYQAATEGMDSDSYLFNANAEFPRGMGSRSDLLAAQKSASYPQGMADFPADVGASTRAAIPSPVALKETNPSVLQKYVTDPLKDFTKNLSTQDILRAGSAGVGALLGRQQSQRAAKEIAAAVQEQKNIASPYQTRGKSLIDAAEQGQLTPQSYQAFKAAQAQINQGVESRGGVGVAQAAAQTEAFRQQLLQNQYDYGLKVSQIGDNIALGAIRTGMQLDQQLAQANQQFYTQLAAIAGGGTYGYAPPQQPRG